MNKKIYQEKIEQIQSLIDNKQYNVANEQLNELYRYKPVRLAWFHLKGQLETYVSNELSKYFDVLSGKISYVYKYESTEECIKQYEKVSIDRNGRFDAKRFQNLLMMLEGDYCFLGESMKAFGRDTAGRQFNWMWKKYMETYAMGEYVIYELQRNLHKKLYPDKGDAGWFKWITNGQTNMGYWNEVINNSKENLLVVMESSDNGPLAGWVCHMLKAMQKKVVLLKQAIQYQDDNIDIQQTISISLNNMKEVNGTIEIVPIEIIRSNGEVQNNIEYILRYLYKKYSSEKGFHILASGWQTEEMCLQQKGEIRTFRVSACTTELLERCFALSFYGEYLSYISKIYQTDCKKLLEQKPTKRFSIVIPARNSSSTLEYTVQTCLEQRFNGEYEILISDNSTGNNTEVYELYKRINDPRVVYIKTPRDLHLPKSFEYAFLHTKGEYVLSLGSDDGLLPWALEILDAVTRTYPDEKIVQWERGFYAWPGFNGGQQHQFVIPRAYKKGELHLYYQERDVYLNAILDNPQNMYTLPMLYINSCFKREYMYDLLNKTGRLWDGICQDIYMGVVTALINPKILNMAYPLTIAGMSSGSVGANANKGITKDTELKTFIVRSQKDSNVGGFCTTYMERLIPDLGTDINSLYNCILRMVSVGALSEEELWNKLDWQKIFLNLYCGLDIRDVTFDKKIHEIRYAASKHGDEFLKWFDEEIYNSAFEIYFLDEEFGKKAENSKTYKNEQKENGGCVLNASEKDVFNIYEAVLLFAEMTKL